MAVLGVMSGTSLDGLDLALCEFDHNEGIYNYNILKTRTLEYTAGQKEKLSLAPTLSAEKYFAFNHLFGKFIGEQIIGFLKECPQQPAAIASHGHTIFHQPHAGFTVQAGCGATIAGITGITTVCDFRSLDVANKGQGAPLVPIGDRLLFENYAACLNIGGIANISFEKNKERIAYDVCFANIVLNFLSEKLGKPYDENGDWARSGKVNESLLGDLKRTLTTNTKPSLSREIFEKTILSLLNVYADSVENKLATFCEYISEEIAKNLTEHHLKNVLVTGGGAYNKFLLELIRQKYSGEMVVPDDQTIQFKEALIFAFLGYLRLNKKTNTLKSVTGASSDSVGGAVYYAGD